MSKKSKAVIKLSYTDGDSYVNIGVTFDRDLDKNDPVHKMAMKIAQDLYGKDCTPIYDANNPVNH